MLSFKKPEISDKKWVDELLKNTSHRNCEFCFGNIYMWADVFNTEIARHEEFLILRSKVEGETSYALSFANGNIPSVISEISDDAVKNNSELMLYGITNSEKYVLEKALPSAFEFVSERRFYEYIYLAEDLINLNGPKYHPKRNHINFFKSNYNWSYEKIDETNIKECKAFNKLWEADNLDKNQDDLKNEMNALNKAFENFTDLNLVGGLIRVDKKVVAYTMGEKLNENTFCTHFEKADAFMRGAYPIINQEFAKNELSAYKYINREDDAGVEGLRKAKLSYHPEILLEKYSARYSL